MKLDLGIKELDEILGGVVMKSLIMIHEADPRSLGKFLAFEVMKAKLESDNLIGYFNLGTPLPLVFSVMEKAGINWKKHLSEQRLMIIDTFGSIYGIRTGLENVWYLQRPVDIDTLNSKYIEVIRAHKERWAKLGMFEGRELWGISVSMSDYPHIFGSQATQKYLEVSDLQRATSDVYKKYPAGTNVWVYSGIDTVVMPLIYRKADYVFRTESRIEKGEVKRYLRIMKAPNLKEVPSLEYTLKKGRVVFG